MLASHLLFFISTGAAILLLVGVVLSAMTRRRPKSQAKVAISGKTVAVSMPTMASPPPEAPRRLARGSVPPPIVEAERVVVLPRRAKRDTSLRPSHARR